MHSPSLPELSAISTPRARVASLRVQSGIHLPDFSWINLLDRLSVSELADIHADHLLQFSETVVCLREYA